MSSALALIAWLSAAPPVMAQPAVLEGVTVERLAAADPGTVIARSGAKPRWLGWSVRAFSHRDLCCWDRGFRRRSCTLDGRPASLGIAEEKGVRLGEPALVLLARAASGRITTLRLLSPDCPVDARGQSVLWLDGVQPAASLALLGATARSADEDLASPAVAAIAEHAGSAPDRLLAELAAPGEPEDLRHEAIFWLGEARAEAGYEILAGLVAREEDEDLLEQLAFALQESPVPAATELLGRLAREDRRAELRRAALFWLAQEGEPGVEELLRAAAVSDPDPEVREHAVFALSELPDERAIDGLIALLRSAGDGEVQRQALFWLSQSDDPRALAAIEGLLEE